MTCNTRVLRIKYIAFADHKLGIPQQFWIHSLGVYSSVSTTDLSSDHNPRDHDWSQGRHSPFLRFLSNQAPLHPRFLLLSLIGLSLRILSLIRLSLRILSLAILPLVLLSAMTRPKIHDCPCSSIGARGLGCA